MKGLFITGTDTGAGKTYVSSLIIEALRAEGHKAVGYKPICCGGREDAYALKQASGDEVDLERVNPCWMRTPAAPYVAGMFENRELEIPSLVQGCHDLASDHELVIAEGVGGWMVPISKEYMVADLARDIGLPVVLVVGNKLGALNQTLLTVQAMRAAGIEPAGMVFNNLVDELDTAAITNKGIAEDLTGVEVLMDVIHGQESVEAWPFEDLIG
ncbi:dethiobiotin synthase [Oceaniferula flava]|uniref:dethiobiotin synthase n=1 Tax=Oceaniferula flava TaxID=2800421 RepID=UPI002867B9EC|nr:dethiobiotin synthase [Oceaniferula flavus]